MRSCSGGSNAHNRVVGDESYTVVGNAFPLLIPTDSTPRRIGHLPASCDDRLVPRWSEVSEWAQAGPGPRHINEGARTRAS